MECGIHGATDFQVCPNLYVFRHLRTSGDTSNASGSEENRNEIVHAENHLRPYREPN